MSVSAPQWVQY
jgi:hypothetical protein